MTVTLVSIVVLTILVVRARTARRHQRAALTHTLLVEPTNRELDAFVDQLSRLADDDAYSDAVARLLCEQTE